MKLASFDMMLPFQEHLTLYHISNQLWQFFEKQLVIKTLICFILI